MCTGTVTLSKMVRVRVRVRVIKQNKPNWGGVKPWRTSFRVFVSTPRSLLHLLKWVHTESLLCGHLVWVVQLDASIRSSGSAIVR